MSIIKSTFENLEKVNSKALVTYTVAGDPNLDTSEKIISEIVSSGADIIEIGVPVNATNVALGKASLIDFAKPYFISPVFLST